MTNSSPPQSANSVGATDAQHQALCDQLQQFVARRMPERIVDALEVIEVEKHKPDPLAMALSETDGSRKAVVEQGSVGQAGKDIMLGHVRHFQHPTA